MNFNIFYQDIIFVLTYEIQCFSFIYRFIYLLCAANFIHNINIIHRSFFPTALRCLTGFLSFFFSLPYLSLPCLFPFPAYFLALPISLTCPCLLPSAYAFFLLPFSSACLPVSLPCLLLCPAYFLALPFSLPCLLPCPTYRSTFFMSARCTGI